MIWIGQLREEDVLGTRNGLTRYNFASAQRAIPEQRINRMVQTDCACQTKQKAVQERSETAHICDGCTSGCQCTLDRWPNQLKECAENDSCKGCCNRNKTRASEEPQKLRQFDFAITIMQEGNGTSDCY